VFLIPVEGKKTVQQRESQREKLQQKWLKLLGEFPRRIQDLEPEVKKISEAEGILWYHVSFRSELHDRVTAYLLIPDKAPARCPALVCIHGTTGGSGKKRTVGMAGFQPDDPPDHPEQSRAYGLELAQRGYITLSIDLYSDGERVPPGLAPYDTQEFYHRHPHWSIMGKNIWDVMRSLDFLETLEQVDSTRIGCIGHSLGGHTTLFSAAFDRRIFASVCNGGILSWVRHTEHWTRSKEFSRQSSSPVASYVYIPRFRPYIQDTTRPLPVDFDSLMILAAPRPLLVMGTEAEMKEHGIPDKFHKALKYYCMLDAGDRFSIFSYPGEHGYPPVSKTFSYSWLDRWMKPILSEEGL